MESSKNLSWLLHPGINAVRHITYGILIGFTLALTSTSVLNYVRVGRQDHQKKAHAPVRRNEPQVLDGVTGLIGNTPLVRINSLSDALGVEILGKAEFLNPGGSVKDRVALRVIEDAEQDGLLCPHTGSRIFEGTVGSTGISIATIAKARGYDATIIMPDDVAEEKIKALQCLGAEVQRVRPASIVDKNQYVVIALEGGCPPDLALPASGINRMTNNIDLALPIIDDAFRITDVEAVAMSRYLVQHDGLFLGSSSACNLVASIKLVRQLGWKDGQTIVTILCDSGNRHYSKFW
ncbi:hypothetical protein ID866_4499 [Astraeus odoratus]|nr:hypothetical protein ID866_4499 [Astraeus odoratus]